MNAFLSSFRKTVAVAGTREVLGASTIQFNSGFFKAEKADGVPNSGIVMIFDAAAGGSREEVWPGAVLPVKIPANGVLNAGQLWIDAAVSGDGVLFVYSFISPEMFNDFESRVEEAILEYLKLVGIVLDDCSFTTGISADERTEDNINVHCQGGTELVQQSGNWDCQVRLQVRSQVGKADSNNRLLRHRERTAWVRDLIMSPEAESTIQALSPSLTVYPGSIRELSGESMVEGRQWVTNFDFKIAVSASNLL